MYGVKRCMSDVRTTHHSAIHIARSEILDESWGRHGDKLVGNDLSSLSTDENNGRPFVSPGWVLFHGMSAGGSDLKPVL